MLRSWVLAVVPVQGETLAERQRRRERQLQQWEQEHGPTPWWITWLLDEYAWMQKGLLPHGQRDQHDWRYLLALMTIETAMRQAEQMMLEEHQRSMPSTSVHLRPGRAQISLPGPRIE